MILSIDSRTNSLGMNYSLMGVWFEHRTELETREFSQVIAPTFNFDKRDLAPLLRSWGSRSRLSVTNFFPAILDINVYLSAHKDFSDALFKRHGFTLDALLFTILALNHIALIPFGLLDSEDSDKIRPLLAQNLLTIPASADIALSVRTTIQYQRSNGSLEQRTRRWSFRKIRYADRLTFYIYPPAFKI